MEKLTSNEIRIMYLKFFENKGHLITPSFPLVPINDNSLLLINSGMAPLKTYFSGLEIPPNKRMATSQKCIRTGDIENIGKTARHLTFFEMLGNFSFGDYFKNEIIEWAWEFVLKQLKLPYERVYISVYYEDEETYKIWNEKIGIPKEKIYKMGKEDNFWEVGIGPCGPCTELYFDRGEEYGCKSPDCKMGCSCDRYIEFWNLVFTQFNKNEEGEYLELQQKNIDTGMGLERIACIMQDVHSVFDIDIMKNIRDTVCKIAQVKYGENSKIDESIRIISDHIRSVTFMTGDGVIPSNEGRGYVLRRLIRRAIRHGKTLGIENKFLTDLVEIVINVYKEAYSELLDKKDYVYKVISSEEEKFYLTLDQGIEVLKKYILDIKNSNINVLSGENAFKMYDTYGFPLELMEEILDEHGIKIDIKSFEEEMEKQKTRARESRDVNSFIGKDMDVYDLLSNEISSKFVGYDTLDINKSKVLSIIVDNKIVDSAIKDDQVQIILNETPLYAEGGGQKGDSGVIEGKSSKIEILDCVKASNDKILHIGKILEGEIRVGEEVSVTVNEKQRRDTARNHSATHLLQKVLKEYLGNHIEQAGSFVSQNRLRFDFTHFSALTREDLINIETSVNNKILESLKVKITEEDIQEAKKMGAMALFGEKYSERVRVANIGDYSLELCGGTHVKNTSEICSFKIISTSSVGAGIRRIEAITGEEALIYYKKQNNTIYHLMEMIKSNEENLLKKFENILNQNKELAIELEKLKFKGVQSNINDIIDNKLNYKNINIISKEVKDYDMSSIRKLGDCIKDKLISGVIILASTFDNKVNLLVMVTDDVIKLGVNAGNIVKEAIDIVGGKGGGRSNIAQAGGKDVSKIQECLNKALEVVKNQIV